MPRSIDDVLEFCYDRIQKLEDQSIPSIGQVYGEEIDALESVVDFIYRVEDRPRRVVKSPSREGAISPERIREACKKVNQRRS